MILLKFGLSKFIKGEAYLRPALAGAVMARSVDSGCSRVSVVRHLGVAPVAGAITLGLMIAMAGMIATEFSPQDTLSASNYEINPQVAEIDIFDKIKPPSRKDEVEIPPPPPTTGFDEAEAPVIDFVELRGEAPTPTQPDLNIDFQGVVPADRSVQPILRFPPVMPSRAARSGHCKVRMDVAPNGSPVNVETTFCSQSVFARATIKAVQKWKYQPKILDGLAVSQSGVTAVVLFRLTDEHGDITPE